MRNPNNNPTDRILRLLAELDELSAAYDSLYERAIKCNVSMGNVMQRPQLLEFHLEMQRQGNNYQRVRPNILKTRERMQTMRDLDTSRGFKMRKGMEVALDGHTLDDDFVQEKPLTANDIEHLLTEQRKRETQEIIERGKQSNVRIGDSYKPPASKDIFSKTKPEEIES